LPFVLRPLVRAEGTRSALITLFWSVDGHPIYSAAN
jgi:protein-S-isoprenylcysteine O-methyltransferase Ste14